jgi:hypothetical protein
VSQLNRTNSGGTAPSSNVRKKIYVISLTLGVAPLMSAGQSPDELKQEIIDRCRASMGKYGASMVKSCVDQDIEALNNVVSLQEKYPDIVNRCLNSMRKYGFAMVESCSKQDIEAEEALKRY